MEDDALSAAKFGGGSFLTEFPAKIRVLSLNARVSNDNYGNTRYAFVVWHHEDNKPKVLNKGSSFARRFQEIHADEDLGGDLRKVDLKITATGTGKETRYNVTPLPKSVELTDEQLKEVASIKLENIIKNGIWLSDLNAGKKIPSSQISPDDSQSDEIPPEDIPF